MVTRNDAGAIFRSWGGIDRSAVGLAWVPVCHRFGCHHLFRLIEGTDSGGGQVGAATDGAGEVVVSTLPGPQSGRGVSATTTVPGCGAALELSVAEARALASMLEALEPVTPVVLCGLDAVHPGPHHALGQVSGPHWWWLRWDDTGEHRELVERAPCCAATDDEAAGEVGVPCALPAGHPGSHSYVRPA